MDSPEYLVDSDIRKLLSVIDDPRDQAVVITILTTGLFLSELICLDLESIDFEAKRLAVVGKRHRTLDLSTTTITAITKYLTTRPKTPEVALFVTERGVPKRLSDRSVDHIIRSAAKAADLDVNYHALRNTFIVRSLRKSDVKTTAKVLGVDREALARFDAITRPQSSPHAQIDDAEDLFDTRSPLGKLVHIIHPTPPTIPVQKTTQSLTRFCIFGREKTVCKATDAIQNNQSVLLTGPAGIGKSHILKALAEVLPNSILIKSPVPFKTMLLEIAKTMCPDATFTQRTATTEILESIFAADLLILPVILIDNMERLKASEEEVMMTLSDKFPIVAATETKPERLKSLWWKFQELPIEPLDTATVKQLVSHLTQDHSMNPDDYTMLETKVLNLANGNPFAVVELISQLPNRKKVTFDHVRQIHHEAGIVYRDWTWVIMVLWGLLAISRFIALGTHSFEGYIIAGIGTTTFVVFKTFLKMKR